MVNPRAGRGRAPERWKRAAAALRRHGVAVETYLTSERGHATALARDAVIRGTSVVAAVGGDGTVHEVINGLYAVDLAAAALAVVPAGTGHDFLRNTALTRGLPAAVDRLLRGQERRIDLGLRQGSPGHVFANFAETGIGAAVVEERARQTGRLPGRLSFLVAALRAVQEYSDYHVRVDVDGDLVFLGTAASVVVANGAYFGAGMKIAPKASVDDGRLDVVVLGDFSRAEIAAQIWKIYPGLHLEHPKVAWTQGTAIDVQIRPATHLDLDGELYESGAASLTVLPQALRILV